MSTEQVVVAEVGPASTVAEVIGAGLAVSIIRLVRHDAGARLGEDPEDVHAARVATRRLRSDLRTFRSVLDPSWAASLRDELAWLGGELGPVRDAEVLLGRLRARADELLPVDAEAAAALLGGLSVRRDEARARLLGSMRGPRYSSLLDRLVQAANAPAVVEGAGGQGSGGLGTLMAAPWGHLRAAAAAAATEPSDEALHRLRIRTKRARYAAEALAPTFDRPARGFVRAATELQDILGEHQDAVVAQAWLRGAAARAGAPRAFAAGLLAEQEHRAQAAASAAWPHGWKTLARKRFRFWR